MSKKESIELIRVPEPPPGPLGRFDLVTVALGTVLGTGIISLLPSGIAHMGTSAVFGFPLAVLIGFIFMLPVVFVSSCLRMSGGLMSLAGDLGTPLMAGLYGLGNTLTAFALGMYGLTMANYAKAVFPAVNVKVFACVVVLAFFVVNLMGSKTMARFQNVMFVVLLIGLVLFIVMGIPKMTQPVFDFKSPTFMPNDFKTTLSGLIILFGACNAYQLTACQGRAAKNATRDMPFALAACAVVIFVLYFGCAVVAAGVLPLEEAGGSTLLATIQAVFPNWLYLIWLVAVPGLLVCTTLNGLMSAFMQQLAQCARDGWLPQSWAKENKHGAHPIPLLILVVIAIVPTVSGLSVSQIILCTNILAVVFEVILVVALWKLPARYADIWKKSKWHVPNWVFYTACVLRVAIRIVAAWSSITTLSTVTVVGCVAIVLVIIGWCFYRSRAGKTTIRVAVWPPSDADAVKQ